MYAGIFILLATLQLSHHSKVPTHESSDDLPIKYPGPAEPSNNRPGTDNIHGDVNIPDDCKNMTYCTKKSRYYPDKEFSNMFKGKNVITGPELILEEIADRVGDPEERDNCESVVSYEALYHVRAKRGDWRTVIQAPAENVVQKVRLETCVNPGAKCFTMFPDIPIYQTYCKQDYNLWELLVSDGNNGTEKIQAELPVCCSCHYKTRT